MIGVLQLIENNFLLWKMGGSYGKCFRSRELDMAHSMIWRYANAEERRVERLDAALRSMGSDRVGVLVEELRQERLLQIEHHRAILEFLVDTNEARLQYKTRKVMIQAGLELQEEPAQENAIHDVVNGPMLELIAQDPFDQPDNYRAEPLD